MAAEGKNDPYSKLKAYFEYLMEVTPAKESVVVFSPPYFDAWGLGMKANNDCILVHGTYRLPCQLREMNGLKDENILTV